MQSSMLTRTKGGGSGLLEAVGGPCAPVHSFLEVLAHPQTAATGMIQKVPGLDLELMGLPVAFDGERPPERRPLRGSASTTGRSAEAEGPEDHRRHAHALCLARHSADAVRAAHRS